MYVSTWLDKDRATSEEGSGLQEACRDKVATHGCMDRARGHSYSRRHGFAYLLLYNFLAASRNAFFFLSFSFFFF